MMSFFSRLTRRIQKADSLLCVGLDPHPELLTKPTAEAAKEFCLNLIRTTHDLVCAFKPNSAFFEIYGAEGWSVLHAIIAAVPDGIPVILDAKRGDIASTARAYAQTAFEGLGADAVTINPYLGHDALEPFLADPERGVFLLCKTSNPGADEVQGLLIDQDEQLYVYIARQASLWNKKDNLGLVVGAIDPVALANIRKKVPDMWFLAPGIGAQGGDLEKALRSGLRSDGMGMVLSVSRSIAGAEDPRAETAKLREMINSVRQKLDRIVEDDPELPPHLADLADELLAVGCVQFGDYTLKSGQKSPIYIDLRILVSHPGLLSRVASAYRPLLNNMQFDRLVALPYAALPITTALSLQTGLPMIYPRKEKKDYGTKAEIEGEFTKGETVVVIDDLATTGGSKLEAIERLKSVGMQVHDVVVLIDRQGGASAALAEVNCHMHSVFTLMGLIEHWEQSGKVSLQQAAEVRGYLGIGEG